MLRNVFIICVGLGLAFSSLQAQPAPPLSSLDYYAEDDRLGSYIRTTLERNPSVQGSLARYRASLQKIPQITTLPDPMINFTQFVRSVETRVGPQLNTLMLSQRFPWFGELDLRGKTAFKESAALYQLHRARQREVVSQLKLAYYELSFVDRALDITMGEKLLLEHYERLAQSRYSSGQGLRQAVIKIQAEISKTMNRLEMFRRQRQSLVARLNTLMDQQPEAVVPPIEKLPLPEVALDQQELYQLGERYRQELLAAEARIEKNEQAIELAKKSFWPDLTLGAGLINLGERGDPAGRLMPPPDNGKNAFNFSVGINIPIWKKKYRAEVLEATESLIAERHNYLDLRNEMQFSVRDQVIRLETLQEQIDLFDRVLVPQAREALRSTESAYQTGLVGALDLLDSERVLLEVRLINARYYADYHSALARLERAIGTRFPR